MLYSADESGVMAAAERTGTDLGRRAAIGVVLAAVAITALWLGGAVLWALLTIVAVIALIEWAGLVKAHRARLGIGIVILLVGMSYALPILWGTDRATLALLLIAALLMMLFPKAAGVALGVGYIGTAAIAILFLRAQPQGFPARIVDVGGRVGDRYRRLFRRPRDRRGPARASYQPQ